MFALPQVRILTARSKTRLTMIGVAADVGHVNTKSKVTGHDATPSALREALTGAEIVVIPAGVPRKPGMTRDGKPPKSID